MAKHPNDREIRDRFSRKHLVSEKSNAKRLEAIRLAIENVGKVVRDQLPEELGNQEPIYNALDDVLDRAVAVFERRSGVPLSGEPKLTSAIRTMPLRMEGGHGRSIPLTEPLVLSPAPVEGIDPLLLVPDPNAIFNPPPAA